MGHTIRPPGRPRSDPPPAYALPASPPGPARLVGGSAWAHVMAKAAMPNAGDLCDLRASWGPDEDMRRRLLVYNPAKLYGF